MVKPGNINSDNPDEISIDEIFSKTRSLLNYLKNKWLIILIISLVGGICGLAYSILKKVTYFADSTFVLDEGDKSGGLGQYADLASLAGVSLNSGGGLFEGDNILQLYKSRLMISKTLLSTYDFNGKKQLLIDRYIDFNHMRAKWKSKDDIDTINFNGDQDKFDRKQDSIITDLTKTFDTKYLNVDKPDKKLSIISVEIKSYDELFAKAFAEKLVDNVNTFFIDTKTKKSAQNVQVLQHQADSVRAVLNSSISGVASAIDAAPNANPQLLTLRVPSQKKQVDVQASTAVYSEIVKNLEISQIGLRKETPLIQMIDTPILPLDNNKVTKIKGTLLGLLLGAILGSFWIFIKYLVSKVLQ